MTPRDPAPVEPSGETGGHGRVRVDGVDADGVDAVGADTGGVDSVDQLRLWGEGLTRADLVLLDMVAADRDDAVTRLTALLVAGGRVTDGTAFRRAVDAREHQMATGLPGGIGLPHARSAAVTQASLAVGIARFGHRIDFGAADGPADIVLLLGTPATSFSLHLEIIAGIARSLARANVRESLRRAYDAEVIAELINATLWFPGQA